MISYAGFISLYEPCCVCAYVYVCFLFSACHSCKYCLLGVGQTTSFLFSVLIVVKMWMTQWLQAGSPIWTMNSVFQYSSQLFCQCFACETENLNCCSHAHIVSQRRLFCSRCKKLVCNLCRVSCGIDSRYWQDEQEKKCVKVQLIYRFKVFKNMMV